MGCILIAMPKVDDAKHLSEMLRNRNLLMDIEVCQTAAEILRISNDRDYGVILCTKNLKDMGYIELAEYLPRYFGMILLTKDMGMEVFSDNVVKLMMPFKTSELISTIDMISGQYIRQIRKKKSVPIKRSQAEQKIIDEAKMLLIDRNGMTESEAFRYIQKTSMDTGRNMVESAQMILLLNDG